MIHTRIAPFIRKFSDECKGNVLKIDGNHLGLKTEFCNATRMNMTK